MSPREIILSNNRAEQGIARLGFGDGLYHNQSVVQCADPECIYGSQRCETMPWKTIKKAWE